MKLKLGLSSISEYTVQGLLWCFEHLSFIAAVAIGCAWWFFLARNGASLSMDSLGYLQTATYMYFEGEYNTSVTVWPPLFPFISCLTLNFETIMHYWLLPSIPKDSGSAHVLLSILI